MSRGFFVVLLQERKKSPVQWKAELLYPIKGWTKTVGITMQDAMDGQKVQYFSQMEQGQSVPDLIDGKLFPMATGQAVRFVHLEN